MSTPALQALNEVTAHSDNFRKRLTQAIDEDGYMYMRGRKVLLIYEDTGKSTAGDTRTISDMLVK